MLHYLHCSATVTGGDAGATGAVVAAEAEAGAAAAAATATATATATAAAAAAVAERSEARRIWRRFCRNKPAVAGLVMLAIGVAAAVFAPYLAPYDPIQMRLADSRLPPSLAHPFGCDELGRDILSRVIYGFRISLTIGAISVGIGLAGGVVMGAVAGFFGGWVDLVVMRVVDIMLSFPAILLAIVVVVVLGPGLANAMVAIGVAQVPSYARLARATVLKWKSEQFVEAARALGASDARIIARHILPNCVSPLIVESTLAVATSILSAASLGFLGLGAVPPTPEWGVMLSRGQIYMRIAPHITVFPGLAILVTVMAFNLVGDGLRDALDPRML